MRHQKTAGILVITLFVIGPALSAGEPTVKLRGYIAAKSDDGNLRILQDAVQLSPGTKFVLEDAPQGEQFGLQDLTPGMLIEAQGTWLGKHQFAAQKVTCDWDQFDKEIKESAFLDYEPEQPEKISSPVPAQLKVDGEVLTMNEKTKRAVQPLTSPGTGGANPPGTKLMWRRVRYRGVRGSDGKVNAEEVEIGSPPPLDAFKIGDDVKVVRGRDPQTGIEVLEFRNKKEVLARMKLFPVQQVQDYVSSLGTKLLQSKSCLPRTHQNFDSM
jgi:hypothetical protein